ncbi:MAG TPA: SulP family inorganic anion transporter [Microlunatus sp.]
MSKASAAGRSVELPVLGWLRGYRREWLRGDLLAGATITAFLVPQVMAYSEVAGLPASSGLWGCMGALFLYGFFGTSRQLSVGPDSTTALMTAAALGTIPAAATAPEAFAAMLALLVAAICLLATLARLAVFAELLSRPVLVGYMAGIAVIMIVSQLGNLTGVPLSQQGVVRRVGELATHLGEVHLPTLIIGGGTTAAMLIGSAFFPRAPIALLGMLASAGVVALLGLEAQGVRVVGDIAIALPHPAVPSVDPGQVVSMVPSALGIAFVAFTDNVLTGRAFASRRGEVINARRELLSLGAANLGAGLLHGFPVSCSGSRTAVGDVAGSRTQLTGYATLACTLIAVFTLSPVLEAFPVPALGAVVVYAAIKLIDVDEFRRFARFRRSELVIALATTVAVLAVGVLWGVVVAIGLSVLDLLRRVVHPHDAVEGYVPGLAGMHDVDDYPTAAPVGGLIIYRYDSPLFFANAEDFLARAREAVVESDTPVEWFVLNTEAIVEVDITAADALESLRLELTEIGIVFALARVKQDLLAQLQPSGLLDRIGAELLFPTLPTAVDAFNRRDTTPTDR